ncbi:hypothetical protein M3P05_01730 [Sansalvadorimonas sp. 2012CJ34-2]|uniref:DUF885 domain-containing protein n=1 Tax=Parendozoicomonas callyspongiae TaxID=2942213 RepID=A0ABT0PBL0_9GAMM|nr:hypothetical protein [Sansalvadorimonas sp. 2012CJ34-2]MCL6268673.1 hypothetical protein [Sansalvadorimonas sp. 2012CJ34-2]
MGIREIVSAGALTMTLSVTGMSFADWQPYPADLFKPDLSGDKLSELWPALTRSTQDVLPTVDYFQQRMAANKLYGDYLLKQLKASADFSGAALDQAGLEALSLALQEGWRLHFEGDFVQAKDRGLAAGTSEGKYLAYRAQTIYAMYQAPDPAGNLQAAERVVLLKEVSDKLLEEISAMTKSGVEPSVQLSFWQTYAYARYVEIVKPTWGILDKKSGVTTILTSLDKVFSLSPTMPALHAVYGGTFAAIYEDGMAARATFKKRLRLADGQKISDYEQATLDQFDSALRTLRDKPFPQLYFSYGAALERLDKKRGDNKYKDSASSYFHYAQGGSLPAGVSNMIYSAEDALAQRHAGSKKL